MKTMDLQKKIFCCRQGGIRKQEAEEFWNSGQFNMMGDIVNH